MYLFGASLCIVLSVTNVWSITVKGMGSFEGRI
jgi:hypothetical protein